MLVPSKSLGGPWLRGALGRKREPFWRGRLGPEGPLAPGLGPGPLEAGEPLGPSPGSPWLGGPLALGALARPWPGGPLAGGPWLGPKIESPQNHEIEQPACLDPSPASWSRNPAARGQGAPGGEGPANPEPKTLNHLQRQSITIWGYTLATLKVVWVPAIP